MTAKEARQTAQSITASKEALQLAYINNQICKTANQGKMEMYTVDMLYDEVKAELMEQGFEVSYVERSMISFTTRSDSLCTKISWEQ